MTFTLKKVDVLPDVVDLLLKKRDRFRKDKNFQEADQIRVALEEKGYEVIDHGSKTILFERVSQEKPHDLTPYLILFGSGEISSTGRQIHEAIFKRINKDSINICLIPTPAGFQPNVKHVYQEIADFFYRRLKNFHPQISIIFANTKDDVNNKSFLEPIDKADYIFTGPGSPTYAARTLKNSLLIKKVEEQVFMKKKTLCLSSAATIAFSRHALPVYEIYKAGEDLHWQEGLNVFEKLYEKVTVIPHLNNKEGGKTLDTSFCYMGRDRFNKLRSMLSPDEKVLGIDEHTAAVINLHTQKIEVLGKGKLHEL